MGAQAASLEDPASTRLRPHVEDCLAIGWSPEQIAGRMELYGLGHPISYESIYRLRLQPHRLARGPAAPARTAQSEAGPTAPQWRPRNCILNRTPIRQRLKFGAVA